MRPPLPYGLAARSALDEFKRDRGEFTMNDQTEAGHREAAVVAIKAANVAREAVNLAGKAVKVATELRGQVTDLTGELFTAMDRAHAALERGAADEAREILAPFALACPAASSPLPSAI